MGRIRKFTQEAYDALQSGVSDDGEILDFFSDIPLNISNFFNSLELEDDLSNFQSYLRDISDFENYTAKKIDDILPIKRKKVKKLSKIDKQLLHKYFKDLTLEKPDIVYLDDIDLEIRNDK